MTIREYLRGTLIDIIEVSILCAVFIAALVVVGLEELAYWARGE